MATDGLSLVAFMDQPAAVNHLRIHCVPKDPADAALIAEWTTARAKLGNPIERAGNPDIQPIPAAHAPYIQNLSMLPWVAPSLAMLPGASFVSVEIDPLLAFQFTVDVDRSGHHCGALNNPPTFEQLLRVCLPDTVMRDTMQQSVQGQSAIIKSRSLNIVKVGAGIAGDFMGLQFGNALPFAHVVRLNGRCYLHNGFHRAYGVRKAGATHMPCLFRDVPDATTAGIKTGGETFPLALLESTNPPAVGHFTQDRAHSVRMRAHSRILHVSWAEYVVWDE